MSVSREALQSRFRATLQTRANSLRAMIEMLEVMAEDPEALPRVLGELHTLKGESRMLGLVELSELAHGMEEHFRVRTPPNLAVLLSATDAVLFSLEASTPSEVGLAKLRAARAEVLGGEPVNDTFAQQSEPILSVPAVAPHAKSAASSGTTSSATAGRDSSRWVQVDARTVDALCDRMSELAAEFARLNALLSGFEAKGREQRAVSDVREQVQRCQGVIDGCSTTTWGLRLTPLEPTLRELMRHAERIAQGVGKRVKVTIDCGRVELERDVVERVWDSLLHLVQNAVDHGLEEESQRGSKQEMGCLRLGARSSGSSVVLEVEDDGRGIDVASVRAAAIEKGLLSEEQAKNRSDEDVLQVIFDHGFSTRSEVSHLSGRGVGLNVVRRGVEALGGHVHVRTSVGEGTLFSIHVPHAMTRERILVVALGDTLYGIPSRIVLEVVGREHLPPSDSREAHVLRRRGGTLPLRSLGDALSIPGDVAHDVGCVVRLGGRPYALRVPRIVSEQELIRRPADPLLLSRAGIGGSAMLEDGRLVLLLDLSHLERAMAGARRVVRRQQRPARRRARQRVLVVDDSPVVREMVGELLTSAGLDVQLATNGVEALATLEEFVPDLVLSDLEMPQMDGLELLERVRSRSQQLPVVMLTTRGALEDRRRAASLGANAYVLKTNFRSDLLLDVVSRFVRVS